MHGIVVKRPERPPFMPRYRQTAHLVAVPAHAAFHHHQGFIRGCNSTVTLGRAATVSLDWRAEVERHLCKAP